MTQYRSKTDPGHGSWGGVTPSAWASSGSFPWRQHTKTVSLHCGALADSRRNSMPIASDLSPVPGAQDLPANPVFLNIHQALNNWRMGVSH